MWDGIINILGKTDVRGVFNEVAAGTELRYQVSAYNFYHI